MRQQFTDKAFLRVAHRMFRELVAAPEFSCLGAKAAFNSDTYHLATYPELASPESTGELGTDLAQFASSAATKQSDYSTFIAVFQQPLDLSEAQFEGRLWEQLRALHRIDRSEWDPNVSSDPDSPTFSFSFAGQAFYVIGMHRQSSRPARRFPWPTLVFNPHEQFERLRSEGKWRRMQAAIRQREVATHGSINPMLSDFGERSEARQYSGRVVTDDWKPPFPEAGGKCPFGH